MDLLSFASEAGSIDEWIDLDPHLRESPVWKAEPRLDPSVEDRLLLAAAAKLTRDLAVAQPWIYWTDLLTTCAIAYFALICTLVLPFGAFTVACCMVTLLAFYRGISFIHELAHVRPDDLPGFAMAWNVMIGVPLLTPSFMHSGVHALHHSKANYGTVADPEYLPLASASPMAVALFIVLAGLAPVALLVRFALLAPLSIISPPLRRLVVERCSSLAINPRFRRRCPTGSLRRDWLVLEVATSIWAISIVGFAAVGAIDARGVAICLSIGIGVAVLNQIRTLASHLWENEGGEPMSLTAQYLDSVNVPPPAALPALWAPVGLRYHGLHHLLPSVPYHSLGEAHRRLTAHLGSASAFHVGNHRSLLALVCRVMPGRSYSRR